MCKTRYEINGDVTMRPWDDGQVRVNIDVTDKFKNGRNKEVDEVYIIFDNVGEAEAWLDALYEQLKGVYRVYKKIYKKRKEQKEAL